MLSIVSQLVTEEFAEMSQKLEMEQGLRHHAEEFAQQVVLPKLGIFLKANVVVIHIMNNV